MLARALFALLLLMCAPSGAQPPPSDLAALVGTYHGQAYNGADLDPVTTTLRFTSGRLTGEYVIEDEAATFHGTISNAFFEDGKLIMEWTDRDGEGYAELVFSADFRRFDGFWASHDSPFEGPWTGVKE